MQGYYKNKNPVRLKLHTDTHNDHCYVTGFSSVWREIAVDKEW